MQPEKISERLERIRISRGWTFEQLAVALDLSASMVSLVISGRRNLGRRSINRLRALEDGKPQGTTEVLVAADPSLSRNEVAKIKRAARQLQELAEQDGKLADVLCSAIDTGFVLTMKNKKSK